MILTTDQYDINNELNTKLIILLNMHNIVNKIH